MKRHTDKTFRVHFTAAQDRVCTLRRRLAAGLLTPAQAAHDLVAVLYGEDYTACVVAAHTLGEHGGPEAIPPLVETLLWTDEGQRYFSRQLRCAAIDALQRIGGDDDMVMNALLATRWDPDPDVAERASNAVAARLDREAMPSTSRWQRESHLPA